MLASLGSEREKKPTLGSGKGERACGQLEKQKGCLLFTFSISGLISRDVKSLRTGLGTGTRRASTSLPATGCVIPPKDIQVLTPIHVTLNVKRDFCSCDLEMGDYAVEEKAM